MLRDRRDVPLILHMAIMSGVLFPLATWLFLPGHFSWWLGLVYYTLNVGFFADRYVFLNHNQAHSPIFTKRFELLNYYPRVVLAYLFFVTPGFYFAHHVMMHHAEDNGADDPSTTLPFRRDSAADFFRYALRFTFLGWLDVARYHAAKGRRGVLRTIAGELSVLVLVGALIAFNWRAAVCVCVAPMVVMHFAMMIGNWGNHAFVDPRSPDNAYRNSVVLTAPWYHRRTFNDGFHVAHHLRPGLHWTDLPAEFENNRETYGREDAVVLERINYLGLWWFLLTKNYDAIADRFVKLPGAPERTKDQVVALLRDRAQPILA